MIKGAVSPAILDIANIIPVRTPLFAAGRIIFKIIFLFGIPKDCPASLMEFGTIFSVSSVTLTTIGIIINDRANAPAHTENEPSAITSVTYATMPITIEGKPTRTSLKNLTLEGNIPFPANSDR